MDVKKGGLDLSALKFDLANADAFQSWQKIFERVRDGEMPPKKKPQPEKAEADKFLASLKPALVKADADDIAVNGRVRSRRLTRTEYENTMHDLLGIDMPLKVLLPDD
ncbi:MAG: Planctomycete cytochrome, partial [Prosthecobacter sp.]|nr:Planctomycete cytochrome [Prosthecobacter sp.]